MKIKVNKHKSSTIEVLREEVKLSNTRTAYVMHIPTKLSLSKKQPQAKIAVAFLFGQLHFNNVTSHALFFRRPSCYAQKEIHSAIPGNHLKRRPCRKIKATPNPTTLIVKYH